MVFLHLYSPLELLVKKRKEFLPGSSIYLVAILFKLLKAT